MLRSDAKGGKVGGLRETEDGLEYIYQKESELMLGSPAADSKWKSPHHQNQMLCRRACPSIRIFPFSVEFLGHLDSSNRAVWPRSPSIGLL